MNVAVWNVLLAVAWMLITGTFTVGNFVVGAVIGAAILIATQSVPGMSKMSRRMWRAFSLAGFTLVELIKANLRVARDLMRPQRQLKPGFIDLPLDLESDAQISLLATLITLTPGTTAIDVSEDRKVLYIHSISITDSDIEVARREIKEGFERRIRELGE